MDKLRRIVTKPWVVMPLVAIVALGGYSVLRPDDGAGDAASAQNTAQLVEATLGTMAQTVSAGGTIAAADTDDLSFAAAGTVTAVNVQAGQEVVAGDVLATIDSAELEAAVAEAEASVAEAEASLADDEEAGGASVAQLEADQSSLTSAQDRLASAQEALDGAQLVASFDGTVAAVNLTLGEELSSGGTGGTSTTGTGSGSGQTANPLGTGQDIGGGGGGGGTDTTATADIQVVSTASYAVELAVDDTDIANLDVGQAASVSLSTSTGAAGGLGFPGGGGAFPGGGGGFPGSTNAGRGDDTDTETGTAVVPDVASVIGEVTEVGQIADASSGVASYPVTVTFTDDSGDYNVGATVSVDITYAEVTDVVQVPSIAVTTTDGVSTVTVSTDGNQETRTVATGLTAGTMVEITSGLEAGEQVLLALRGGARGGAGGGQGGPPGFGVATTGDGQ